MTDYLAVYDITDPRRLRRVAKLMQKYGVRVQKSVFECHLTQSAFSTMKSQAMKLIHPETDGVRFYPLFAKARQKQTILGAGSSPVFPTAYFA